MERGWPSERLASSARRVSSPSAAKTGACIGQAAAGLRLELLGDIGFDVLHLLLPATFVLAESLFAAFARNVLEARLGHGEQRTRGNLLQPELNQRRRLGRIIDVGVDGIRVPGI